MTALVLSYLHEFNLDREVLRIRLNHKAGLIEFEYREIAAPLYKRGTKACSPDEAFSVLARFLKMKKWFTLSERTLRDAFGEIRED